MAKIKAPYNFVPLSEKVFFPDWADQISHDMPFEKGLDGVVLLNIKAESPVFVRDSNTDERKDGDKTIPVFHFCHFVDNDGNWKYFIPATSVKGMIRNVLEIISFGKMNPQLVQNSSFGIRDLSTGTDGSFYRQKIKPENIRCGYLSQTTNGYRLEDHGLPWRISAEALDNKFGCGLVDFIKNKENLKHDENRTAKAKYQLFEDENLVSHFIVDEETREILKVGNRQFVMFNDNGDEGEIVFTGQSGVREVNMRRRTKSGKFSWTGKFFEFVFPSEQDGSPITFREDSDVIKSFITIHQNSPDFKDFRKPQLLSGSKIPVFFMYDEDGNVDSIGLSYMYKYPAYNTIYGGIPDELQSSNADLAECIFGNISNVGANSIKGRVQFSSAWLVSNHTESDKGQPIALSSPHPSFYPTYLRDGLTWNSENISIAGRKRYPVRNKIEPNEGSDGMMSEIHPLPEGSEFRCKMIFHNLKPEELGALVDAISFLNHEECFHSIGQGKPLGYGKVKISIVDNGGMPIEESVKAFEEQMANIIPNWKNSVQMRELFAMAAGIPQGRDNEFTYLKMSKDGSKNEFKTAKSAYANGEQLGLFTEIIKGAVPTNTHTAKDFSTSKRVDAELRRLKLQQILNEYKTNGITDDLYDRIKSYEKIYGTPTELNFIKKQIASDIKSKNDYEEALQAFNAKDFNKAENLLKGYIDNNYDYKRPAVLDMLNQVTAARVEMNSIVERARVLLGSNNIDELTESVAMFEEAGKIGFGTFDTDITIARYKIQQNKELNGSLADYLATFKLASIAAFAGKLRRKGNISNNDLSIIADFLNVNIPTLKKSDQKSWRDYSKWKPIQEAIGGDLAKTLFEMLK